MRGWEWRSLETVTPDERAYHVLFDVAPSLGKWKAALIRVPASGAPVAVLRFEDQPGKSGGLHLHAECGDDRGLVGAESLAMRYTLLDHGRVRRRRQAWMKALFRSMACKTFRVALVADQEEMSL